MMQATYKAALQKFIQSGVVTRDEAKIAKALRVSHKIDAETHVQTLEELGCTEQQWKALEEKGNAPPKASPRGERWALLIANSQYTHGQEVLTNPDVDVKLITTSLLEVCCACARVVHYEPMVGCQVSVPGSPAGAHDG